MESFFYYSPLFFCFLGIAISMRSSEEMTRRILMLAFGLSAVIQIGVLVFGPIIAPFQSESISQIVFHQFRPYIVFCLLLFGFGLTALYPLSHNVRFGLGGTALTVFASLLLVFLPDSPLIRIIAWSAPFYPLCWMMRTSQLQDTRRALLPFALSILTFIAGELALLFDSPQAASWAFLIAFLSRSGVFPFHHWLIALFKSKLPLSFTLALFLPHASILFVFTHGSLPLVTDQIQAWAPLCSVLTALYGAYLAFGATDARSAFSYFLLSQSGLALFGLGSSDIAGTVATLSTWMGLTISLTGMVLVYGALEARNGRVTLTVPGGSFSTNPLLAVSFLFFGLASIGIPGTLTFVSEELLLQSSASLLPIKAGMLIIAISLNAIQVMRLYFYLFQGVRGSSGVGDLNAREYVAVSLFMLFLLFGGLFPSLLLKTPAEGANQPSHSNGARYLEAEKPNHT